MFIVERWLFVTTLLVGLSAGQQQQCTNIKKTHTTIARLRESARMLLDQFPIDSADRCSDLCCQWNSAGSYCNAAVFSPSSSDGSNVDEGAHGKCTLIDCRPTFGNCVWTWSPVAGSSVYRVFRVNKTPRTQQHQNLLLSEQLFPIHKPSSETSSDTIATSADSSRDTVPTAESTRPLGSVSTSLGTPVASTTRVPTTTGNDDDASYYDDDYDYENIQPKTIGTLTTTAVAAAAVSSLFSTAGGNDDDVTSWHMGGGTFDNPDAHQNEAVTSTSSESSSLLPTSRTPVVDVQNELVTDKENTTSVNVDVPGQSATDTNVDKQSSPSSSQSVLSKSLIEPLDHSSREDDSNEWKPTFTESRSKSHPKYRIGSDLYDGDRNANDELIIAADPPNDETNSIKMTAFLLPSSDTSEDSRSQQVPVFLLVSISLVTVICLLIIIVGCRKMCSGRPRYTALTDDPRGSHGCDFQTNYLVSQPSSLYRASLLDK